MARVNKHTSTPLLCAALLCAVHGFALAKDTYTFSVVPQQAAKKLAQVWTPILKEVSAKSGLNLTFTTAKNIPTFEQRLAKGEYDLSYMNPYHYTVFSKDPGYVAFAKRKNQKIQGILVARKDSPIKSLEELKGKTLAFPAPAAFAATILPQANLKLKGIDFTPQYVSSHDSVYLSVSKKLFPVGGGVKRTFNSTDPSVRNNLKVLWETKGYTPHAFAAHPKIPKNDLAKVQQAFISLNNTAQGKQLLKSIAIKNGLEKAVDSDWDDVRALNISIIK